MALKGDLSNLNLGDLFQTLNQNQQTGTLKIWSRSQTREIYFTPHGVTLLNTGGRAGHRLGERFLNAGRITVDDLESCLRVAEKRHKPLGTILVERNLVSGTDIERALGEQIEDEIYSLFTWTEGRFEFIQGERELEEGIGEQWTPSFFDVGAVLLEAARRIDEWGEIHRRIEDLTEVFVPSKLADYITSRLDDEELLVFEAIDGRSDVRTIADTCERPIFETAKIIHSFLEAGYVREAKVDELLEGAKELERQGRKDRVKTILRLVIQRRQVSDPRILRHIADVFVGMQNFDDAADIFCEAAHFLNEADRREEAIDLLHGATSVAEKHLASRLLLLRLLRQGDITHRREHAELVVQIIEILNDEKRKEDAAPFCEDLIEIGVDELKDIARAANAVLLAGQNEIAIELLERAAADATAAGQLPRAVELYQEVLRVAPDNKRVATHLRELRTTAAAKRRRKFVLIGVVVLAALGAWMTWERVATHRRSQELLSELEELDQRGNSMAAMNLAMRIRMEFEGTVAAEKAQKTIERLERQKADQIEKEKAEIVRQNEDRMLRAGNEVGLGNLDDAMILYREVLQTPHAKEHIPIIRSRLQAMLEDAELAEKQLTLLLRDLPEDLERMETSAVQRTITRLRELLSHLQPAQIARLRETFGTPVFAKLANERLRLPETDWIESVTQVTARGHVAVQDLEGILTRHRERDELDEVYQAAHKAEEAGNFETALTLYEHVAQKRAGSGTQLFQEKVERMRALVLLLRRIEVAREERNFEEAVEILETLVALQPDVNWTKRIQLPFLLRSIPTDAEVTSEGKVLGRTPLPIDYQPDEESRLTIRREGFVSEVFVLRGRELGEHTVVLQARPAAVHVVEGAIESAVRVTPRTIYVADRGGHLTALDPSSGDLLWKERVVSSLGGLKGTPVVHDEFVHVMSYEGELHRRRLDGHGFEVWADIGREPFLGPVTTPGRIHVARDRTLQGIDLEHRGRITSTEFAKPIHDVLAVGDHLYVSLRDGLLIQVDEATGAENWRRPGTGSVTYLLEHGDRVLCFRSDGRVVAREIANGRELWRITLPAAAMRHPVLQDERVLVPVGREILAVAIEDGQRLGSWRCEIPSAMPVTIASRLLVPAGDELVSYDQETGRVLSRFRTEGRILAAPHVREGRIWLTTDRGRITVLDLH